jgi:two-component system sensor histidine kinase TctE
MDKHIDLGYDGAPSSPGCGCGKLTLLKEMIRNLLDNAINSRLRASASGRCGGCGDPFGRAAEWRIQGPGIPQSGRGVSAFWRWEQRRRLGAGLPIVLEIARQHNARDHAEDSHPPRATRHSAPYASC